MSLSGYYFDHIGLKNCYFFPSLCRRRRSHSICLLANFSIIWSSSQQVNIIKKSLHCFSAHFDLARLSRLIFNPTNERMLAGHEKSYKSLLSVYQSSWSSGGRRGREVKQQQKKNVLVVFYNIQHMQAAHIQEIQISCSSRVNLLHDRSIAWNLI